MSVETPRLDGIIEEFVKNHSHDVSEDQIDLLSQALRNDIIKETMQLRVTKEALDYKRKLLCGIRITLVIETIFLAFFVGLIVNQTTNLIPERFCWCVIIVSLLLCVLLVVAATSEPKS